MRTATVCAMAALALLTVTSLAHASSTFQYVSPRPEATLVSKATTLAFRAQGAAAPSFPVITVSGATSGTHSGNWILADDARTMIFRPANAFAPGEVVSVTVTLDGASESYDFTVSPRTGTENFAMSDCDCLEDGAPTKVGGSAPMMADGVAKPAGFPNYQITINTNPSEGRVFVAPGTWLAIMENDGTFCYFSNRHTRCTDFEKSPSGNLTFMERDPDEPGFARAKGFVMDNTYTVIDEYAAGNGYGPDTDFHEFTQLPNGNVILMAYDPEPVDMSKIVSGGNPSATVAGLILQELDPSHNVIFQWRSWDHFQITDTYQSLTAGFIDYVHGNAIEVDTDGNWLISSRNLSEVTKIDRQTGDVIWRLGGKNNQFMLLSGTFFTRQHDIRRLANGHVTVYDNGNDSSPQESRAVEYALVETGTKTANQVWEFRHPSMVFSPFTGSNRRLPNGNTFISWGTGQRQTEVDPSGNIVWEVTGLGTYRGFRQTWEGAVAAIPTLWVATAGRQLTLHFVKFGDDNVARYRVYRGSSPTTLEPIGSTTGDSFVVRGYPSGVPIYFKVRPVDGEGNVGAPSEVLDFTPNFDNMGTNLFAAVADIHPKNLQTASKGKWITAYIEVPDANLEGIDIYSILLNDQVPAQPQPTAIGDNDGDGVPDLMVKFRRADVVGLLDTPLEMRRAMMSFTVSGLLETGHFGDEDEIRVARKPYTPSGPNVPMRTGRTTSDEAVLHQNYPNPFNPVTSISFDVPTASLVDLAVFDLSGSRVRTLHHGSVEAGSISVTWDGRNDANQPVASGIYFYRLSDGRQVITRKMLLLK